MGWKTWQKKTFQVGVRRYLQAHTYLNWREIRTQFIWLHTTDIDEKLETLKYFSLL